MLLHDPDQAAETLKKLELLDRELARSPYYENLLAAESAEFARAVAAEARDERRDLSTAPTAFSPNVHRDAERRVSVGAVVAMMAICVVGFLATYGAASLASGPVVVTSERQPTLDDVVSLLPSSGQTSLEASGTPPTSSVW